MVKIISSICTYIIDGKLLGFTKDDLLSSFRSNATRIGEDKLDFKPKNIRTHSNRCAAAMAMLMDDTPVYMIILIGRWSSDAFLKYIQH